MRATAATPEPDDLEPSSDRTSQRVAPRGPRIPTLAKVVGAAAVILLGVYLLSRQRDRALTEVPAAAEPPAVPTPAPSGS